MSGLVVWITGLPSSGKSTFAQAAQSKLKQAGVPVCVLDSDDLRKTVFPWLGYESHDRDTFYAALGNLAGLLASQGLAVLVPATAHLRRYREQARKAAPKFLEVYVRTEIEECRRRDNKGLYARAAAGELTDVPGVQIAFEQPSKPDVIAEDGRSERALEAVSAQVRQWFEKI